MLNGTNPDPILSYIFFFHQLNVMQKNVIGAVFIHWNISYRRYRTYCIYCSMLLTIFFTWYPIGCTYVQYLLPPPQKKRACMKKKELKNSSMELDGRNKTRFFGGGKGGITLMYK